ncbi:MAG: hypothetical protein KDC98_17030, partial [Planctomycetes bacterium]|nr:hypothetical protein [Planctomycetota bacterium]
EHGLMYQTVAPRTGRVLDATIHDNWGYDYNGFHTVWLLDGVERYRAATRKALTSLRPHYWQHPWQGWGADGIADAVEGAINLFAREPDVEGVAGWLDANIARMLRIQKPDGIVEGWHGDGNFARTALMWALWKQQGVTLQPWREDTAVGAVRHGDEIRIVVTAERDWDGTLVFDTPRHRRHMKLPLDYPRINQFPEWFTVEADGRYRVDGEAEPGAEQVARTEVGATLAAGLTVSVHGGVALRLTVAPTP